MKIIMHNDQAILVDKYPGKFFVKHWDDAKTDVYIIVDNKRYYLEDLLRDWRKSK